MKTSRFGRNTFLAIAFFFAAGSALGAEEPILPDPELGTWVEREDGRHLQLIVEEQKFQLYFFDAEKQPIRPDAVRAVVHFSLRTRGRENTTLVPVGAGPFLEAPRLLPPPYRFPVMLVLVHDPEGERTETYNFAFRQD